MTRLVSSCSAAMAVLLATPISATLTVPADLGDLVATARAIAHAHVSIVDARVVRGARAIERVVTFQVERYFKGDFGAEIRVRVPGGELGTYRTVMVGAPRFSPGDELVLFLGQHDAEPYILGLSQGAFRVVPGTGLGSRVVVPAMLAALAEADEPVRVRRGDRLRRPTPFGEFAAAVERLVAERGDEQGVGR